MEKKVTYEAVAIYKEEIIDLLNQIIETLDLDCKSKTIGGLFIFINGNANEVHIIPGVI